MDLLPRSKCLTVRHRGPCSICSVIIGSQTLPEGLRLRYSKWHEEAQALHAAPVMAGGFRARLLYILKSAALHQLERLRRDAWTNGASAS